MYSNKIRLCLVGNINSVHLQKWVNYFSKKSAFEVLVISTSKPDSKSKNTYFYEDLAPKWMKNFLKNPKISFFPFTLFFKKYLKNLDPDILHIHQLNREGLILALAESKPVVISVWGSDIRVMGGFAQRILKRKVLKKAKVVTASSKYLADTTKKVTTSNLNVKVIPFGVDIIFFDPKKYKKINKNITIGFAKHLKAIYGVDILIKAFKKVSEKFNNVELVIAGEGELEKTLKILVKDLDLEKKVAFVGWIPQEEMPKFISKIDIFVMPTVVPEAFGVAALEASAMEVPVVASRIGGIPEVIKDNTTGILVGSGRVDELFRAITKLVEDKNLRERMGKAGRKFVKENYEWNRNALKMEGLYKELVRGLLPKYD